MLKAKKIKLSGFRGILNPQELNLMPKGAKEPRSLVLFGLNSSGKTSFVDGLEWFLSPENKIDWLRRDEAEEKAYPHQAAKEKSIGSFVEIEFLDTTNKVGTLTKTFNQNKPKRPTLSDQTGFENIYSSFVIRPFFRYLEIVEFVCSKGKEKYERLAQWMGFESEFAFQETLARGVQQELKQYEKEVADRVSSQEEQLKQLIDGRVPIDTEVFNFCNDILNDNKITECKNVSDIWNHIPQLSKRRHVSSELAVIDKLTKLETSIGASVLDGKLSKEVKQLEEAILDFRKDQALVDQINVIELYSQGLGILGKLTDKQTKCPLCGKEWERASLIEHIKKELQLLNETKEKRDDLKNDASTLKSTIESEIKVIWKILGYYEDAQETIKEIEYPECTKYLEELNRLVNDLTRIPADTKVRIELVKDITEKVTKERSAIVEQIKAHKVEIQPSAEETKLSEDIEKLTQTKSAWLGLEKARLEQAFVTQELNGFYALRDAVVRTVQQNIKSRFEEISNRIGRYFAILRDDKDITDIKIVLNVERGKAAGRSAEIELNYYNISVRPAYKILSESLLNSLGLAVYFTCVKQFNNDCGFIFLDDIMNSLDIDKRDTLLDLLAEEFAEHQIIIFTHDYFWFQRIVRRFPQWDHRKIKDWDYIGGPKIDPVFSSRKEIESLLSDSTKTESAGWTLGKHVESMLNELCEKLWAQVRYRYTKNELPTMVELFDALYARLKRKVKTHPATAQVLEAKKYEPTLRNFVSHAQDNQPTSVHPKDIKRACDEWFSFEAQVLCDECHRLVEYHRSKDSIECKCGRKKLVPPAE